MLPRRLKPHALRSQDDETPVIGIQYSNHRRFLEVT